MSRIDELISEHCPTGVTFMRLGDLVRIRNGKDHKQLGAGDIPVYGSGGVMRYADTFAYDRPSVLIPRKGSLGNLFYVDGPFWTVDTIFYTEIDDSLVLPKFLYYFLTTVGLGEMNQAGGVPSQTQSVLNELRIPVPPQSVQREIVTILDKMERLKAELEAELELRSRQRRYYLNRLLSFEDMDVHWAMLRDLGHFVRGKRFTKSDYAEEGVGCIHYGEIYTHYGTSTKRVFSHLRPEMAKALRYAEPGDVVIVDVGETVDDVGKAVAWLGEEPVAIHDHSYAFRHDLNPAYVSYVMQTDWFVRQRAKYIARTKVKTMLVEGFARIEIPVPDRNEQDRIVQILNKFDALVNDLSVGLPAEIKARQTQYEYYRDKLLNFEELPA